MSDDLTNTGVTFARVMAVHARALIATESELLALAKERAADPSVFEEFPPYFFGGEISSNRWDAYETRMGLSTLQNYATEAEAGVAYLRGHQNREDPTGGTLRGQFARNDADQLALVKADFYVPLTPANVEHVARIRSGVVRDLSVGFYGGEWICSICGRDMYDWFAEDWCPHFLGVEYVVKGESGESAVQKARATIENAHLAEVSGVYDGATPGAMIAKARFMATEGFLDTRQRELVQVRYRIHLPGASRHLAGATVPPPVAVRDESTGGNEMSEATTERQPPAEPMADLLTTRKALNEGETPIMALTRILDDRERLRSLADDGRAYRSDLIEGALAEGVRAQGNDFAKEMYRAVLERSSLDEIKRFKDDWAGIAARALPGGRQTVDTEEQRTAPVTQVLPDEAFRA